MSGLRFGVSGRPRKTADGDGPTLPEDFGSAMSSGRAFADDAECGLPEPKRKSKGKPFGEGGWYLSRRAIIFWCAGIVFAMVWVFALGILVGRGTIYQNMAFQRIEKGLGPDRSSAANPPQVIMETTSPPGSAPVASEEKLTYYDTLIKNKEQPTAPLPATPMPPPVETVPVPEADTAPVVEAEATAPPKPAPKSTPKPPLNKEKAAAPVDESPFEDDAPPPPKVEVTSGVKTVEETESQAPAPKRKPGENFTVQVAIANSVKEAESLTKKLEAKGYAPYFYEVEEKGQRYIRVRVGRYKTREEAAQTVDKLTADGRKGMFISILTD